ncbi:hypothetical protein COLO4_20831 [Corchorus olitorius]|uniref:Uncharacterized protein n=1 Tax=Corchorus olitorius TaxID=93759 RepID=A0A1R3IWT2_9ROSI|nr:hypothetical protein COLO4_20831 [Corchorus olitorius]
MASCIRALSQPPMNTKACLKPRLGALEREDDQCVVFGVKD